MFVRGDPPPPPLPPPPPPPSRPPRPPAPHPQPSHPNTIQLLAVSRDHVVLMQTSLVQCHAFRAYISSGSLSFVLFTWRCPQQFLSSRLVGAAQGSKPLRLERSLLFFCSGEGAEQLSGSSNAKEGGEGHGARPEGCQDRRADGRGP